MIELARATAVAVSAALVPARCSGCGAPGDWFCFSCRDGLGPISANVHGIRLRAAGAYDGSLRTAVHRFKYREERGLAEELGGLVAPLVAADLARGSTIDAVVPVPLHRARALARGYDQTALLAAVVARESGVPSVPALRRIRHAPPQIELDRAARLRNVDGAFVGCVSSLRGLHVALIDDVATTGATCRAAALAARACGARSVRAYVVAVDE